MQRHIATIEYLIPMMSLLPTMSKTEVIKDKKSTSASIDLIRPLILVFAKFIQLPYQDNKGIIANLKAMNCAPNGYILAAG